MRWIIRSVLILAALGLLWLGLVLSHWLPRPTAEEQAALAAFEQPQAQVSGERNAAEFLRLFEYVLTADELAEVSAIDQANLARFERPEDEFQFQTHAEGRYARLPPVEAADWHCDPWREQSGPHCLDQIRANEAAARSLIVEHAARLQKEMALAEFDHVATLLPAFNAHITGSLHPGVLVMVAAAIEHLDGHTQAALDRLCTHASAWRQLRGNSDSLLNQMIGVAAISRLLRMTSEIQAEAPGIHPKACEDAFRPLADRELLMCAVMRGEFDFQHQAAQTLDAAEQDRWWDRLVRRVYNRRHTEARLALPLAWYCQEGHAERVRTRSATPVPAEHQCSFWQHASNPIGCILADIASPTFDRYYLRTLDLDGRLRLYQVARWIAESGRDPVAALAELSVEMRSPEHEFSVDGSGRLRMSVLDNSRGEYWTLAPMARERPD